MPLRAATAALTLALLAAACTTPAAPEATPASEVTRQPTPPASAPAGSTVGVWVVDSQTGAVAILYEGDAEPLIPDASHPTFTPSGVVWLADTAGATRYAPSGGGLAVIEAGSGVIESNEARARTYYLASDGAEPVLMIERPLGTTRTVGPDGIRPAFSPSGASLAYLARSEGERFDLVVLDTNLAQRQVRATGLQLCQCEDFSRPVWSPSGDYIAYSNFAAPVSDGPGDRGSFVVEAFGPGEPVRVAGEPGAVVGWLPDASNTLLVGPGSGPALFDAATAEQRPLILAAPQLQGIATLAPGGGHVQLWASTGDTFLVDPRTGIELVHWQVHGNSALTPVGPAIAIDRRSGTFAPVPSCLGVLIAHPRLFVPQCVTGAARSFWSPDGSTLAILGAPAANDRWLEFWTLGAAQFRMLIPPSAEPVEWSPDGRYLLVVWGIGD